MQIQCNDRFIFALSDSARGCISCIRALSIFQEMKVEDDETGRHHFDTCNGFWGRPGHGAPKSAVKKQKLDRLLYPQMVPISVH
jgi:hypothetical protein